MVSAGSFSYEKQNMPVYEIVSSSSESFKIGDKIISCAESTMVKNDGSDYFLISESNVIGILN